MAPERPANRPWNQAWHAGRLVVTDLRVPETCLYKVLQECSRLEADICAWIATWNDNPRPYVWTKTADEILEEHRALSTNSIRRRTLASAFHE